MLNPIHTRKLPFSKSPFASIEDVDEYIDHVTKIVEDALGREPAVSISLTYPDRAFPTMTRDEFSAAKGELPFQDLTRIDVSVTDEQDSDFDVRLVVTAGAGGGLSVRGRSVTRVDGVDVQVRKQLDRLWETQEHEARRRRGKRIEAAGRFAAGALPGVPVAPIAAEAARLLMLKGQRSRGSSAGPLPAGAGPWRRFVNNQWTITIVGGAIAAAIAVGLVALVVLLAASAFPGDSPSGRQSEGAQTRGASGLP